MSRFLKTFDNIGAVALKAGLLLLITGGLVRGQSALATPVSAVKDSLERFLRKLDGNRTTRYVAAFPDLNSDGVPEAVVYLIGNDWCGSGGCNTLILSQDGDSWKTITEITITQPPIRVLSRTSNGWHNIGVRVRGGGIQPGYEAELRYDGKTYPSNPSTLPARRMEEGVQGEVVVPSSSSAIPLYPVRSTAPSSGESNVPLPSFDCTHAKTPTEKQVCRDADLASMDNAMAIAYKQVLQQRSIEKANALRREQVAWFKQYARACDSVISDVERKECIVQQLGNRTRQLRTEVP